MFKHLYTKNNTSLTNNFSYFIGKSYKLATVLLSFVYLRLGLAVIRSTIIKFSTYDK
jgi:hypothetical protein